MMTPEEIARELAALKAGCEQSFEDVRESEHTCEAAAVVAGRCLYAGEPVEAREPVFTHTVYHQVFFNGITHIEGDRWNADTWPWAQTPEEAFSFTRDRWARYREQHPGGRLYWRWSPEMKTYRYWKTGQVGYAARMCMAIGPTDAELLAMAKQTRASLSESVREKSLQA